MDATVDDGIENVLLQPTANCPHTICDMQILVVVAYLIRGMGSQAGECAGAVLRQSLGADWIRQDILAASPNRIFDNPQCQINDKGQET